MEMEKFEIRSSNGHLQMDMPMMHNINIIV